jgi:TetR/AcrR family transcriptional regulator, transcriptional repressor of bet genes
MRNGLEATTLRDIAREGGFTTGVVTHYFPDKRAVIAGAFAVASHDWLEDARAAISGADSPERELEALVGVALPDDARRRGEWRLWSEMWTYAGRDPKFAGELIETDALWEFEIRSVLERTRRVGAIREIDVAVEARLLARLIDGLGLRAWLSGRWPEARGELVAHLSTLGVAEPVLDRMRGDAEDGGR